MTTLSGFGTPTLTVVVDCVIKPIASPLTGASVDDSVVVVDAEPGEELVPVGLAFAVVLEAPAVTTCRAAIGCHSGINALRFRSLVIRC